MDAISNILSPVTASNTATSQAAVASTTNAATLAVESPGASASVRTFFSDFARNLLAQQTLDPNLNVDTAVTSSLLNPSVNYSLGGQLYTSAGLLEQYATAQFLSQLESGQTSDSGNAGAAATSSLPFFGSTDGSQTLLNLLGSYEQISLLGSSLSLLDGGLGTETATSVATENAFSVRLAATTTNTVSTNATTSSAAAGSAVSASA
jgi:hypothetical protein